MKILFLIDSLGSGGAQRQIAFLAQILSQRDHDIYLVSYAEGATHEKLLSSTNVKRIRLQKKRKVDLRLSKAIAEIYKDNDCEVACAFLFTPSLHLILSKLFNRDIRVVVSERTFEGYVSKYNKFITRRLYQYAQAVVCNSHHQKQLLISLGFRWSSKVLVIPNGVDPKRFFPAEGRGEGDEIICIGRVSKLKNTLTVINALSMLKKRGRSISVQWVGKTNPDAKESTYFDECVAAIQREKLSDSWAFVGAVDNVEEILRAQALLIHASFGEGFPNVICEAMASSVPVIASNVYDHPRIVKEGVNGYLFDPNSAEELAGKIQKFLNLSPIDKGEMSGNALMTALESFSPEMYAQSYEVLFTEVISQGSFGKPFGSHDKNPIDAELD